MHFFKQNGKQTNLAWFMQQEADPVLASLWVRLRRTFPCLFYLGSIAHSEPLDHCVCGEKLCPAVKRTLLK